MRRKHSSIVILLTLLVSLSGCTSVGDKTASLSIVYAATAICSLLLLVAYCLLVHKKDIWFILLFSAVLIVNIGYYWLSVSRNLNEALMANRIAYLGSVFLPMTMLRSIMAVCKVRCKKWLSSCLIVIAVAVFFIAASAPYLDIYYKDVSFEIIDGVSTLKKVYGSWHVLYLIYLLSYFSAMVGIIVYSSVRKHIASNKHAIILLGAVLVNLCVWLLEQLVKIDFEFLSVSYIISELFLTSIYLMLQESSQLSNRNPVPAEKIEAEIPTDICEYFAAQIRTLTPTERRIYDLYLSGKGTKEVLLELNIKENTLKYHNKNIYGKLGVSSRKQLLEFAHALEKRS